MLSIKHCRVNGMFSSSVSLKCLFRLPNTFICVDNIQISLKMGDVAWPKTFLCGQCSQYPEDHFTPQSPNAGNVRYLWKEICVNK